MQVNYWIIPQDVNFVPSINMRKQVEDHLSEFLPDDVTYERERHFVSERLVFIDGDYGWFSMTKIGCPACRSEVSIATPWAEDLRNVLVDDQVDFSQFRTDMPCCSANVSVLDIDFKGLGGFTKFAVVLNEADYDGSDEDLMRELQKALDCGLRKVEIWYT